MSEYEKVYRSEEFRVRVRSRSRVYWSAVLGLSGLWLFLILAAPVAAASEIRGASDALYGFFSYACHQQAERSFFVLGHKFAVCSRCFGVYFGLFGAILLYPFLRPMDESDPLPRFWLFASMVPMAIDWSLGMLGIWENTFVSRFLTGLLLGIGCAIFIVPALIEIAELRLAKTWSATKKAAG